MRETKKNKTRSKSHRYRKIGGDNPQFGNPAPLTSNPRFCHGHFTQCQDAVSQICDNVPATTLYNLPTAPPPPSPPQGPNPICLSGGGLLDVTGNKNYCHGHVSQCQDSYSSCQNGGYHHDMELPMSNQQAYEGYKNYKRLYKKLKLQLHGEN